METPAGQLTYPQALTDNLWVLGNHYFNLYLVRGTKATALVEVGVSAVVDRVIAQLEALGTVPDFLVLTHPHTDHFSGLAGLRQRFPQAVTIAARGARKFVSHPKAAGMMIAEDRFMAQRLADLNIPPGRASLESIDFPEAHTAVENGWRLDLGGITLRCLEVKGHSPGNLVAHLPELETLLLSDSLGFHFPGRGFCPLFFTGYHPYLATLDGLAKLRPKIVGPGHQGPFLGQDADTAIPRARQAALDLYAHITEGRNDGQEIAAKLFDDFYRDEFTLYSRENIRNCMELLVRRAHEAGQAI